MLVEALHRVDKQADHISGVAQRAKEDETAHRLMPIPSLGPVTAVALAPLARRLKSRTVPCRLRGAHALAPFHGRQAEARRHVEDRQADPAALLILGARGVLRWAAPNGAPAGSWLRPWQASRQCWRVAFANKMARAIWALVVHSLDSDYHADF